jgi:two-component system, chemotaxis family, sensor kinase CheA
VTDLSGRGVGMDVVRKQIQKMRGRVDIESVLGQGTTFILKLPLTLAIVDGLVVAVGGERYIIPIFAVKEMLRPAPDALTTVEGKAEMALVRGRLLPVVRLHECFGIEPKHRDPAEALLIVSECEGKPFALMVDELTGKQEVVLKSLGELMKDTRGLTGCAILGDGRVGLILDVEALFRG